MLQRLASAAALGLAALTLANLNGAQPPSAGAQPLSGAAAVGNCDRGSYCLFMRKNYEGNAIVSDTCCVWLNLHGKYDNNVSSAKNRTEARLFLASGRDGTGRRICLNPFSNTSSLGGFNNRASSFKRAKVLGPHCH